MIETTVKIDGMMCGMCESHVNDAVRGVMKVKKVSSSHAKGTTVILHEEQLDEAGLRQAIEKTGYKVLDVKTAPYEAKKGLFSLFRR